MPNVTSSTSRDARSNVLRHAVSDILVSSFAVVVCKSYTSLEAEVESFSAIAEVSSETLEPM